MSLLSHIRLSKKKRNSLEKGEIELLFVRFLCNSDGISVDVGANKGNYSLEMSKYSKKVYCIEPNLRFNRYLKKMPKNCEILNHAVTNIKESLYLHAPIKKGKPKYNEAFISVENDINDSEFVSKVSAIELDKFQDDNVSMIKIDVEGNEMSVLESGINLIAKQKPNFLIESLCKQELKAQIDFFEKNDYVALKIIRDDLLFVKDESIFDKCRGVDRNTIFIPNN